MSFVRVSVVDPEGNSHEAEVDPRSDLESILRDIASDLGLSPPEDYQIRHSGRIREGSILVIDKRKSRSARIL